MSRQIDRIGSLQMTPDDFMTEAETAADFVPEQQILRLSRELECHKIMPSPQLKLIDDNTRYTNLTIPPVIPFNNVVEILAPP